MKNKVDNWIENLVRNYQLPEQTQSTTPRKVLTEAQKKIILGKK
jgi:hypothetical protein